MDEEPRADGPDHLQERPPWIQPGSAEPPPSPPRTPAQARPGGPRSAVPPWVWILGVLGIFLLALSLFLNLVLLMAFAAPGLSGPSGTFIEKKIDGQGRHKILVIDVAGVISRGETVLFFPAPDMVEQIKARLDAAAKDDRVKAVILRVDSPGGTVTASDEIHKAVADFRAETKKPVVSLMGSVAASGGYYVSMACDRVVAHEATITGSIGVIMQFLNYKGLFDKYGLRYETIIPENASLKAIGSGDREMTDKERAVLASMVEQMYELFIERVKGGRPKLREEQIREAADGRIYTGKQALALGLVDALGDLDTAVEEVRKLAGLDADPLVVEYHTVAPFGGLFGAHSALDGAGDRQALADLARGIEARTCPRLYFLYQG